MTSPTFILGSAQTDFARVWSREGLDLSDMVREIVPAALADAQLDAAQVDSIHVGNAFAELWGVPAMRHEGACASSSLTVLSAMAEIEAGG